MADELVDQKNPYRIAFGKHLKLVAEAMGAIEWVDSGDWEYGDELEAVQAALGDAHQEKAVSELKEQVRLLRDILDKVSPPE